MRAKSQLIHTLLLIAVVGLILALVGCAAGGPSGLVSNPRAQYDYAMEKFTAGHYSEAIKQFQRLLLGFPGLSYIDSAQYYYARSYQESGEYHLAVGEYKRVVNNFPSSDLVDDAQYMIGLCYFQAAPDNPGLDQTDTEDAIRYLKNFINDYPYSPRKAEAEQTLAEATERIVTKQLKNGKQYYKLGYLKAARIYFEDLVTSYPKSDLAPEALYLLARIDERQEKYTDARDKLNNLINAFPDSEYAGKAKERLPELNQKVAEQNSSSSVESAQVSEDKSE